MSTANASRKERTVGDSNAEYESLKPLWARCRAIVSGERYSKEYDSIIDIAGGRNLLIPFSPSMTPTQYDFYKMEAELPGIVSQFTKMLVGGLLRKQPVLKLPDNAPEDAANWILNEIGQDGSALTSVLDQALFEELQTSRAWVYVDHPVVTEAQAAELSPEELKEIKPYVVLWKAEHVINWRTRKNLFGKVVLDRVITREFKERFTEKNEFHPEQIDTVTVHELDESGFYRIRVFERMDAAQAVPVVVGQKQTDTNRTSPRFELTSVNESILANGERLKVIPAWPLNGNIDIVEPLLTPLVDKEVSLYNKMSRRNHLLYGASTYTPVVSTDMTDDEFEEMVAAGLGSWLRLRPGETATVLDTPTAALADMDRAIAAAIEEMARMGIRMLSPEAVQSGVALEIRNAAQNAQLGTLNTKVSNTMRQIICLLLNWRYDLELRPSDIGFDLSSDFNPTPLGPDWLRLATEWYQAGLIPRSSWLEMLKQNDMLPPDYDDEAGQEEITQDAETQMQTQQDSYAATLKLESELAGTTRTKPPKSK